MGQGTQSMLLRYQRQIILPEIGIDGQTQLQQAKVLVVGVGGLGCPALLYLAAAGIGELGLMDHDCVDISNLHRQILFNESHLGQSKVDVAVKILHQLNSEVIYNTHCTRLVADNATDILQHYDIVIDASDNFATKYLLNDCCYQLNIPLVYAALTRFEGYVSVFWPPHSGCYRCLYPSPSKALIPNCAENGVIGALCGIVGSMQAMEVIKLIIFRQKLGKVIRMEPMFNQLWMIDTANFKTRTLAIRPNDNCMCSADRTSVILESEDSCFTCNLVKEIDLTAIDELHDKANIQFIDVRDQHEWERGSIPGAIHFPLSSLLQANKFSLCKNIAYNKSTVYIVYCQQACRSQRAAQYMAKLNLNNIYYLHGGFENYTFSELSVV